MTLARMMAKSLIADIFLSSIIFRKLKQINSSNSGYVLFYEVIAKPSFKNDNENK